MFTFKNNNQKKLHDIEKSIGEQKHTANKTHSVYANITPSDHGLGRGSSTLTPSQEGHSAASRPIHAVQQDGTQKHATTCSDSPYEGPISSYSGLENIQKDPKERWAQLKLLETLREKAWAEFTPLRTEVCTLFALVPLTIALEMISEGDWNTLINKPQRDDRRKPLVLDQNQLEHVISDQLDILEEYSSTLAELRHEIKDEEVHQEEKFQQTVLSALTEVREPVKVGFQSILPGNDHNCLEELKTIVQNETSEIQELIASGIDHVRNAVTDAIRKPSPPAASEDAIDDGGDDSNGEGGTEVLQSEPDPLSKRSLSSRMRNLRECRSRRGAEEYEAMMWQRRRQIDREIFDAYAEIEELDNLIAELKREPKCEPRDISRGVIRRWTKERFVVFFAGESENTIAILARFTRKAQCADRY
ncbi:unnamed protein product [Haemonchus placei]|uniref:DUF4455 domain-containing protein n=1 Tax=Haemonchus placei TaxID=6290 RepID=A0A0N4X4I8_HAEPC|nr:unnamed protein product [Haemonchus placei]